MSVNDNAAISVKPKLLIVGGDRRFSYLYDAFLQDGFRVYSYASPSPDIKSEYDLPSALKKADAVILPYPLSPDGVFLNSIGTTSISLRSLFSEISKNDIKQVFAGAVKTDIMSMASSLGVDIIDYSHSEALLLKNAICTAEGALEILLRELPVTICDNVFTVIGYGRIGRMIAVRLRSLGATVNAVARKKSDLALMVSDGVTPYDYCYFSSALSDSCAVINTVPATVLDSEILEFIKKDTLILDLASSPGGVDRDAAISLGIKVIWALSLPGKACPKSAAMIIKDALCDLLLQDTDKTEL